MKRDGYRWYKSYVDVAVIGAEPFRVCARETGAVVTNLCELDTLIDLKTEEQLPDDDEALRRLVAKRVPRQYYNKLSVFSKKESNKLSPNRPIDHKIKLTTDSSTLSYSPLYRITLEELEEYKRYMTENLAKGFIVPSSAP